MDIDGRSGLEGRSNAQSKGGRGAILVRQSAMRGGRFAIDGGLCAIEGSGGNLWAERAVWMQAHGGKSIRWSSRHRLRHLRWRSFGGWLRRERSGGLC